MRVFIATPAFNVARYIGDTIWSVRAQTHADWRMLIVDDGSTDGTGDVARGSGDARIAVVRQDNAGVSAARNRALGEIEGDAVMWLDGDDCLAPDALERLVAALDPGTVAAYGAYCFTDEAGTQIVQHKPGPFPNGDILRRLLVQNQFANGGHVLIRREAAERVGRFRADLRYGEDWEYWCRLATIGPFAVAAGPAPLLRVRQRGGGAILRMASDPTSFAPCMDAIFGNPEIAARIGAAALQRLRHRTEAENAWIVGRELVRHGRRAEGLAWLRASAWAAPSARRALLLAAAHGLDLLPARLHGPFRAYAAAR
jgi:hypothetical protein